MIVNYLNNGGVQKCTREEIERVLNVSLTNLGQMDEVEVNIAFCKEDEIKQVKKIFAKIIDIKPKVVYYI